MPSKSCLRAPAMSESAMHLGDLRPRPRCSEPLFLGSAAGALIGRRPLIFQALRPRSSTQRHGPCSRPAAGGRNATPGQRRRGTASQGTATRGAFAAHLPAPQMQSLATAAAG